MAYKTLRLDEIKRRYEHFVANPQVDENSLDQNYQKLRKLCLDKYKEIKESAKSQSSKSSLHYIDMNFGFFLYEYLKQQNDFTSKYESSYEFWRYFAVCVIPDIIADRWNITKSDHFYSKPTGIYPFQVYWYIKLSWQGTKEKTIQILENNQEDQILQLVDRPSSIGVNLDLYRRIMYKLSFVDPKERQDVFRAVMLKNTARLVNIRPELYDGGINAYVDMLYQK
jgi:hypothetical protein